jgi:hypothetical protein
MRKDIYYATAAGIALAAFIAGIMIGRGTFPQLEPITGAPGMLASSSASLCPSARSRRATR